MPSFRYISFLPERNVSHRVIPGSMMDSFLSHLLYTIGPYYMLETKWTPQNCFVNARKQKPRNLNRCAPSLNTKNYFYKYNGIVIFYRGRVLSKGGNKWKHKKAWRKRQETKTMKLETKCPQVETQKDIFMGIMVLSKHCNPYSLLILTNILRFNY